MKAVILCGGKGTRLREETEYRPKPMLPIGNRPILWHIMKIYAAHGIKDFILCLGYKGEMIRDYFRNYLWMSGDVTVGLGREASVEFHGHHDEEDWKVTLADTGVDTLTAGRVERIRNYVGDDDMFLLTYGDGVGDVDIAESIAFHRSHGRLVTITGVHPPGRFGEMQVDASNKVWEFNEKPQTEGGWINGGFFVMSAGVFDYLKDGERVMLEEGPLRQLTREGQVRSYLHTGFWQPMDTYQEYLLLNRLWAGGEAPWRTW